MTDICHRLTALLILCGMLIAGSPLCADEAPPSALPGYRLGVGSVLFYETLAKYDSDGVGFLRFGTNTLFFVGVASNQNWEVLSIEDVSVRDQDGLLKEQSRTFSFFELTQQGRVEPGPIPAQSQTYRHCFIPFPPPADPSSPPPSTPTKWTDQRPLIGEQEAFAFHSKPNKRRWIFTSMISGPVNEINGISETGSYMFDANAGLLERSEFRLQQEQENTRVLGAQVYQLKRADITLNHVLRRLIRDADAYVQARRRYDAKIRASIGRPEDIYRQLREAADILRAQDARTMTSWIKEAIQQDLANHYLGRDHHIQAAEHYRGTIGAAAPAWDARDLAGKPHASENLRGKIQVIDFWHRRSRWSVRSMPQLKTFASDYGDKGVVVLGMNVDPDIKVAQFVADRMSLNYPTLVAGDIAQRYKVAGFPTIAIIDKQGTLRHMHTGYTPAVYETLADLVAPLLGE